LAGLIAEGLELGHQKVESLPPARELVGGRDENARNVFPREKDLVILGDETLNAMCVDQGESHSAVDRVDGTDAAILEARGCV